jgi:hypothetical protein
MTPANSLTKYVKRLKDRPLVSKLMKNKLPLLSFKDLEESTVLAIKLNFLERGKILCSIADAASSRDMAWQQVAHRSRKQFTDEISNTVKWGPCYNLWDLQADDATL